MSKEQFSLTNTTGLCILPPLDGEEEEKKMIDGGVNQDDSCHDQVQLTESDVTVTTSKAVLSSVGDNQTNLIVNYLPQSMTQQEVRRLFSSAGQLDACKLVKDRRTGQSLGYAFVKYKCSSDAKKAVKSFNKLRLENKIIKVSLARPHSDRIRGANVYVSGLGLSLRSKDLENIFSPFGEIINCRVLHDPCTRISRGIGFVLYNLRSEAEEAINKLNHSIQIGCNQPIIVKFASKGQMTSFCSGSSHGAGTALQTSSWTWRPPWTIQNDPPSLVRHFVAFPFPSVPAAAAYTPVQLHHTRLTADIVEKRPKKSHC